MQLVLDNAAFILSAFATNMLLAGLAIPLALPVAALFAFGRMSRVKPVYYSVTLYVNVLRSMPLIMVMFWLYLLSLIAAIYFVVCYSLSRIARWLEKRPV